MGEHVNILLDGGVEAATNQFLADPASGLVKLIPEKLTSFLGGHKSIIVLAAICILTLLAFEGYKLFKMIVYAGSAFAFGYLGITYLAPAIAPSVASFVPGIVDYPALVGVACALIAVFLARCAYPFMIMCLGGVAGYFIGAGPVYKLLIGYFNTLDFLKTDVAKHIVGGVIAAVLAIFFILLFKHIYMVVTSFGGTIGSAILLQSILVPTGDDTVQICFTVLGVSLGIFAIVHQYKEEEKAMEIVF